jgi:hypothetical protein
VELAKSNRSIELDRENEPAIPLSVGARQSDTALEALLARIEVLESQKRRSHSRSPEVHMDAKQQQICHDSNSDAQSHSDDDKISIVE